MEIGSQFKNTEKLTRSNNPPAQGETSKLVIKYESVYRFTFILKQS